ncbi:hypothetical protein [Rhodopirellula bahusiensis]|uniref:Uncharacterized protein n=1 Tax=Rhodopirellula bahusiensis TaxID=2014065 RepID=A0A2G1W963_9BACT|nr:hypothetical protein [Rhodopirellula bahusiensis]PHQ35179.1 hypothetical protein CEE69_12270 [Rhodopirellula bahusiensis]
MSTASKEAKSTERVYGTDPWTWPLLRLDRDSSLFRVYESDIQSGDGTAKPNVAGRVNDDGQPDMYGGDVNLYSASDAWRELYHMDEAEESVSLMVGPGVGPVTLEFPTFHPDQWAVWKIANGDTKPMFMGFFDRLEARDVAKRILAADDCPILATPYLIYTNDWDDESQHGTYYEPRDQTQNDTIAAALPDYSSDDLRRVASPGGLIVNRCVDLVAVLATKSKQGTHWMTVIPEDEAECYVSDCGEDSIEWECLPIRIQLPNLPSSFKLELGETNPDVRLVAHAEVREAVQ